MPPPRVRNGYSQIGGRIMRRKRYNIQHGTIKSIRRRTRGQRGSFIPQIVAGLGKVVLPSIVNRICSPCTGFKKSSRSKCKKYTRMRRNR